MGRNFVKGRSSSRVCTTEPVVALVGLGIEKGRGRRRVKLRGGNTEGMDQFCPMV